MVPGVRVIELAWITRPTSVRWLGLKRTSVGLIGSFGCRMILLTSHADLTISLQQPRPVEHRLRTEMDRVAFVVDQLHAAREPHHRQRRTDTGRHQESSEEPRQQQPEEVKKNEETDRMEHDGPPVGQ